MGPLGFNKGDLYKIFPAGKATFTKGDLRNVEMSFQVTLISSQSL